MVRKLLIAAVAISFCLIQATPSRADEPEAFELAYQYLDTTLTSVEASIEAGNFSSLTARSFRQTIEYVLDEADGLRDAAIEEQQRIERLMVPLGAAPEDGVEEEALRRERVALRSSLAQIEGRVTRADLIAARAEQALSDLGSKSREQFTDNLLEKRISPLQVSAWKTAIPEFFELIYQGYVEAPRAWFQQLQSDEDRAQTAIQLFLLSIAIAAAGWPLSKWLLRRFGRQSDIVEPSYARRMFAAAIEAVSRGLLPTLFVLCVSFLFLTNTDQGFELRLIVEELARYLIIFFIGYGLIKAVFTPDMLSWRLTPLHTGASTRVVKRLRVVLVVYVVIGAIGSSIAWTSLSEALESTSSFVAAMLIFPALWALLRHRVWLRGGATADEEAAKSSDDELPPPSKFWRRMRAILSFLLLSIPISAALGYPRLTLFLINAFILTGLAGAGLLALRWLLRGAFNEVLNGGHQISERVLDFLDIRDQGSARLQGWLNFVVDVILIVLTGAILLPLWGVNSDETVSWLARGFRGIQIGSYTFSIQDILLAIAIFATILLLTRIVQRLFDQHFLASLVRDIGVRTALKTGVGYIGVIIAGLVGISALGLDLSNLAIIAGALSVGLGFGLQNVVSNFVSGLILLAERPIKPGDWIVVGGHEGTVKKVNVRSTEIETFQHASLIIPNADLVASPVTNWTHKNVLGRLEVKIGVAYGTDVELVKETLLEIAKAHPMVALHPEPYVIFADFGASSLDFELRCYLRDIAWVVAVGSDLRFSINQAFNEKGIEIPFPQRVVHLSGSDDT